MHFVTRHDSYHRLASESQRVAISTSAVTDCQCIQTVTLYSRPWLLRDKVTWHMPPAFHSTWSRGANRPCPSYASTYRMRSASLVNEANKESNGSITKETNTYMKTE